MNYIQIAQAALTSNDVPRRLRRRPIDYFISFSTGVGSTKLCHVRQLRLYWRLDAGRRRRRRFKTDKAAPSMKLSSAAVDNRYLVAGRTFPLELLHFIVSFHPPFIQRPCYPVYPCDGAATSLSFVNISFD